MVGGTQIQGRPYFVPFDTKFTISYTLVSGYMSACRANYIFVTIVIPSSYSRRCYEEVIRCHYTLFAPLQVDHNWNSRCTAGAWRLGCNVHEPGTGGDRHIFTTICYSH